MTRITGEYVKSYIGIHKSKYFIQMNLPTLTPACTEVSGSSVAEVVTSQLWGPGFEHALYHPHPPPPTDLHYTQKKKHLHAGMLNQNNCQPKANPSFSPSYCSLGPPVEFSTIHLMQLFSIFQKNQTKFSFSLCWYYYWSLKQACVLESQSAKSTPVNYTCL